MQDNRTRRCDNRVRHEAVIHGRSTHHVEELISSDGLDDPCHFFHSFSQFPAAFRGAQRELRSFSMPEKGSINFSLFESA